MRSATARRPRSRRAQVRLATVLSTTAALLLAVTVVWQSASAGFNDSTAALRPVIGTGTVTLTDDDSEGKLFTVQDLKPGKSAGTRCITVRSTTSTRPADVRMYVTGASSTQSMYGNLNVVVRIGTGGAYGTCSGLTSATQLYSGRLADFPTDGWAKGKQVWTAPAAGQTRTYEITVSLDPATPLSVQGGTAGVTFVWESRLT
jgi:hypothetical protein